MPLFRKKPVVIEATQWFHNGDHPRDNSMGECSDGMLRPKFEGEIVGYFKTRAGNTMTACEVCKRPMLDHGWIDTLEGGHRVCPGDWIITGIKGEHYPCKPDIFAATYEECTYDGLPSAALPPGVDPYVHAAHLMGLEPKKVIPDA